MPKKIKKPISRKPKTKNKNVVNVKINIDNSKKSTARRTPLKPSNMQPFVNFPSFQPTRIQQLEPLKKYNNGDLTKTDDMYQKQFKTYLETTDKTVKDLIEKFDDTLKKNTAPQKPEESKPGASNVYADTEGTTVFTEPIELKKRNITHTKDDSNLKIGFSGWDRKNDFQGNPLTSNTSNLPQANQMAEELKKVGAQDDDNEEYFLGSLFERAPEAQEAQKVEVFDFENFLNNAPDKEIEDYFDKNPDKLIDSEEMIKNIKKKKKLLVNFLRYKAFWESLNPDTVFDMKIDEHKSNVWGTMGTALRKKLTKIN